MADYWKSQARKYCDFCKCWISDNKPSVQFHENGKRHKANVEAKLKEIGKKSVADQKAKKKLDDDMKKMEEAAMKAYMKDVQQNPDLTSQSIKDMAEEKNIILPKPQEEKKKTHWHEAKAEEGHTYYWHSVTGESKWEVPAEGFISLKDQSIKTKPTIVKSIQKPPKRKDKPKGEKFKKKMKKEDVPAVNKEPKPQPVGPYPDPNPYGRWETVVNTVPESIDLQLPERTHIPTKLSQPIYDDEPKIEFKEKTVTSIAGFGDNKKATSCSFQFKKPKINRGNARQRSDDL